MSLAENLKRLREEEELSLRELADYLGISNPYLSQLETGRITNPSLKALRILARFYGLTIDELVGFADDGSNRCGGYYCDERVGYRDCAR